MRCLIWIYTILLENMCIEIRSEDILKRFKKKKIDRHRGMYIKASVVECSPATRAARARFPADAFFFYQICFEGDNIHVLGATAFMS